MSAAEKTDGRDGMNRASNAVKGSHMRPSPQTYVINGVAFSMITPRVMKRYGSTNVLRSFGLVRGKSQHAQ